MGDFPSPPYARMADDRDAHEALCEAEEALASARESPEAESIVACRQHIRNLSIEIKALQGEQKEYFKEEHRNLETELGKIEREELLKREKEKEEATATAASFIQQAQEIQAESAESLTRSKRLVEEAEKIGIETSVKLVQQRHQMISINSTVERTGASIDIAHRKLRTLRRTLMTDKIFLCLLLLLILGLLFVMGWSLTH